MNSPKGKVLFLTMYLPSAKSNGAEVASSCFIESIIRLGYDIYVVGNYKIDQTQCHLKQWEIPVKNIQIESDLVLLRTKIAWIMKSIFMNFPITSAKYFSLKYKFIVNKLLLKHSFDFVVIDHTQIAWTLSLLNNQKVIVIIHNFESDIYHRMGNECSNILKKTLFYLEEKKLKKFEALIQNKAHSVWGLNISDLLPFNGTKCRTKVFKVYSFIDCSVLDTKPGICGDGYVAMLGLWSWLPNARALNWFLYKVLPFLPDDIKIIVGGKGVPNTPTISGRVTFPGFIEDANSFLLSAKVICIPSVDNVGIQIKAIDACASGLPTVATHIAFSGITDPPYFVQIHDDEKMFAEAIIRAFRFPNDRNQMLSAAIKWNEKRMEEFSEDLSSEFNFFHHIKERS